MGLANKQLPLIASYVFLNLIHGMMVYAER
jgi:hypothetical protein